MSEESLKGPMGGLLGVRAGVITESAPGPALAPARLNTDSVVAMPKRHRLPSLLVARCSAALAALGGALGER